MCKKESKGPKKGKGGTKMAVMTKPLNMSLRVSEEKTKEFLSITRDTPAMLKRFKSLKKMELLSGKSETDPDVEFLNEKIREFEKELEEKA